MNMNPSCRVIFIIAHSSGMNNGCMNRESFEREGRLRFGRVEVEAFSAKTAVGGSWWAVRILS